MILRSPKIKLIEHKLFKSFATINLLKAQSSGFHLNCKLDIQFNNPVYYTPVNRPKATP